MYVCMYIYIYIHMFIPVPGCLFWSLRVIEHLLQIVGQAVHLNHTDRVCGGYQTSHRLKTEGVVNAWKPFWIWTGGENDQGNIIRKALISMISLRSLVPKVSCFEDLSGQCRRGAGWAAERARREGPEQLEDVSKSFFLWTILIGSAFSQHCPSKTWFEWVNCQQHIFFWTKPCYSGYTYMAVWVGGLEVWEIRDVCNID